MSLKYSNANTLRQLIILIQQDLAKKIERYSTMPTASASYLEKIVFYDGETIADSYINGDFYKCVSDGQDPATYSWEKYSYNKDEIDSAISAAGHFEAVATLPTTDIKTNIIYLIPKTVILTGYSNTSETNGNVYIFTGTAETPAYDKYVYDSSSTMLTYVYDSEVSGEDALSIKDAIDNGTYTSIQFTAQKREDANIKTEYINLTGTSAGWEKIGDTELDLSNYVQFNDLIAITSEEVSAMWANPTNS